MARMRVFIDPAQRKPVHHREPVNVAHGTLVVVLGKQEFEFRVDEQTGGLGVHASMNDSMSARLFFSIGGGVNTGVLHARPITTYKRKRK